jgi:hypothetical protein
VRYRGDVRVALAVLLGGCGGAGAPRPERPPTPAPAVLELEWAGPPDVSNPGDAERALALFADDEWNRALPCPQSLAERQPAAADRHRCALRAAALGVGDATLWAGLARFGHEFDGMYGSEEAIVLVDARAPGSTDRDADPVGARGQRRRRHVAATTISHGRPRRRRSPPSSASSRSPSSAAGCSRSWTWPRAGRRGVR